MRPLSLFLASFIATSLSAMDPSDPLESASTSKPSITQEEHPSSPNAPKEVVKTIEEPTIADIIRWSESTALSLHFDKVKSEEDFIIATLRFVASKEGPPKNEVQRMLVCIQGNDLAFEFTPVDYTQKTVSGLIQHVTDFISNNRNENNEPTPLKLDHCTVSLHLKNLSNNLPSSAYLPGINTLHVQSTNFETLDGWSFPDLRSAEFMDVSYARIDYMAPPSTCILSSNIFTQPPEEESTFKLVAYNSFAFPEAFAPHLQSGRLQAKCSAGTISGAHLKDAPSPRMGHNFLVSNNMDHSNAERIGLSFDQPQELFPESSPPSLSREPYSDEELEEKTKSNFFIQKDGVWVYSASEKMDFFVPPEIWLHILSFLPNPFELMKWANAFQDAPYLQAFALEKLNTMFGNWENLPRPMIIAHNNPSIRVQDKTLIWGLPYQVVTGVVGTMNNPDRNMAALKGTVSCDIRQEIASTSEYDPSGAQTGERLTVSWSFPGSSYKIVIGRFLWEGSIKNTQVYNVVSAVAFDHVFGQIERFSSKNQKQFFDHSDRDKTGKAIAGPAEVEPSCDRSSISKPLALMNETINPKARAEGSDDGEGDDDEA